ncbi:MAG: hypothetical protein ACUVUF_02935 [Candidatus Bathycorpusculaceae bacterium]
MAEVVKKVALMKPFNVDDIAVSKDHYFRNAYIIDLPLDSAPDHVWLDIFEQKWRSSRHLWDRKMFVMGDKLRLVTTVDDFEEKLDWVEQVLTETNKAVEDYNAAVKMEKELTAKIESETQKQKLWEERARVETLREALRKRFGIV